MLHPSIDNYKAYLYKTGQFSTLPTKLTTNSSQHKELSSWLYVILAVEWSKNWYEE